MKYLKSFNESYVRTEDPELDDKFEKVITILERDCKPFLDEVKTNDIEPILRGARPLSDIDGLDIYKKEVRTDRNPLDTDSEVSKLFDDEFNNQFGVRPRSNGVFTTKNNSTTSAYGLRYLFFPIGEYKYYWNPDVDDFYTKFKNEGWYKEVVKPSKGIARVYKYLKGFTSIEDQIKSKVSLLVNGYKDDDLKSNINQEIIFICKEYYLVDMRYFYNYLKYLDKLN